MASLGAASNVARTAIAAVSTAATSNTGTTNTQGTESGTSGTTSAEVGKGGKLTNALKNGTTASAAQAQTNQQINKLGFSVPGTAGTGTAPAPTPQQAQLPMGAFGPMGGGGSSGGSSSGVSGNRGGGGSGGGGGCGPGGCGNNGGGGGSYTPPIDSSSGSGVTLDPKTNQAATSLNGVMQGANDKPMLVKFGASWCGPCRDFDRQNGISQGGQQTGIPGATLHDKGQYSILKVDVDQNQTLGKQLGVDTSSIPAFGYAYRKEDGSIGVAKSLKEAQEGHTKVADVKIPESKPETSQEKPEEKVRWLGRGPVYPDSDKQDPSSINTQPITPMKLNEKEPEGFSEGPKPKEEPQSPEPPPLPENKIEEPS